jgi:hypothetical protein
VGIVRRMTEYWFNTRTGQVEETEDRSPSRDVLGPYASRAEAEQALETARQRTERWDAEDAAWERRGAADTED